MKNQEYLISMESTIPESLYVALVAQAQESGVSLDDIVVEAIVKFLKSKS